MVDEAPLLEETALHPANEVFDRTLLSRGMGPANLNPQAEIEHDAGKNGVPLGHHSVLPPLERNGLCPIEHGEQRDAAHRDEVIDERPSERLHLLVRNDRDLDPSRVLEARGEEVNSFLHAVEKLDDDLAKVVLCELAGQPL